MTPSARSLVRFALLPFAGYVICYFVLTWPLVLSWPSRYFCDKIDGPTMVWNVWWVKHAIVELHQSPWHTNFVHFPGGSTLLLHCLTPFNGLIGIPLSWVLPPVQVYNAIVTFTFAASGLTCFWLAYRVTGNYWASLAAGFGFAFCAYRWAHAAGHLHVISTEWLPVYVLLLIEMLDRRTHRAAQPLAASQVQRLPICDAASGAEIIGVTVKLEDMKLEASLPAEDSSTRGLFQVFMSSSFMLIPIISATTRRICIAVAAGFVLFAILLCDPHQFVSSLITTAIIVAWYFWHVVKARRRSIDRSFLAAILALGGVALLTCGPIVFGMMREGRRAGPLLNSHAPDFFGADLLGPFVPDWTWNWHNLTRGVWEPIGAYAETSVCIGPAILVAAIFGAWRATGRERRDRSGDDREYSDDRERSASDPVRGDLVAGGPTAGDDRCDGARCANNRRDGARCGDDRCDGAHCADSRRGGARFLRTDRWLWIALAIIFTALSFGPTLYFHARPITTWMPYRLLAAIVPPLRLGGIPARMMIVTQLACCVLAAAGLSRLANLGRGWRLVIAGLFALVLLVESQPRVQFTYSPDAPDWVKAVRDAPDGTAPDLGAPDRASKRGAHVRGAVINLIARGHSGDLYAQTIHGRPIAFAIWRASSATCSPPASTSPTPSRAETSTRWRRPASRTSSSAPANARCRFRWSTKTDSRAFMRSHEERIDPRRHEERDFSSCPSCREFFARAPNENRANLSVRPTHLLPLPRRECAPHRDRRYYFRSCARQPLAAGFCTSF